MLSFGIDKSWRRKAIRKIPSEFCNSKIIDVATGTGDFAIEAMKLHPVSIKGIDISEKMLGIGREKARRLGIGNLLEFINCESEKICFSDNSFDIALAAFGVRNFSDPLKGLSEMSRVVRQGGIAVILEFSKPSDAPFRQVYNLYFRYLLPFMGRIFSKDRRAYRYLNESVMEFIEGEEFIDMMKKAGFEKVTQAKVSWGIATIYSGFKK
jgi:demethylmenaquinone methyltransferase/2-methoxy-6-polyprenyl-1,4-benzoquinol methylase